MEELFESCPAKQSTRTVGHLLTAWAPTLTALVYVVLMTALIERGSAAVFGEIGARQVAAVLGAAVLCIGAACLGVTLARWAPWSIVPILAVFGVGLLSVRLATHGTRTTEPVRQLSTWLGDPEIDLRLTAPHWVAHHVWILALVAVVGAAAVLRDRRGPAVLGVGTLAVAVAVAAAVTATRPIDGADARRIAALLEDPENQPCVDAGGLAVCTFRADDDLTAALSGAVRPTAAAAAPGALVGWSVRQGASVDWSQLDPEVRSLLGATPAPDPRIIPIEMATDPTSLEGARLWAGLAAAGVLDEWTRGTTLDVRGEARGVVALWLATRGVDDEAQRDMTSVGSGDSTSADSGRPWPDSCDEGAGVVRWAATDVFAAREMLAVPQEDVRAVLLADWERWTAARRVDRRAPRGAGPRPRRGGGHHARRGSVLSAAAPMADERSSAAQRATVAARWVGPGAPALVPCRWPRWRPLVGWPPRRSPSWRHVVVTASPGRWSSRPWCAAWSPPSPPTTPRRRRWLQARRAWPGGGCCA